jgi:hypothetical protein
MGVVILAGLTAVALAAAPALGQTGSPVFRSGSGMAAGQPGVGTGIAGGAVPAYAQGYPAATPFAGTPYASIYSAGTNPFAASMSSTSAPGAGNGYGSGSSYYPPYGYQESAYGGYLRGNADVINATGQYLINYEQAKLGREMVRQARIDTRRKVFDEYLYERANTPTVEDERERLQHEAWRRAVNDPPVTEIWSARALNDLLRDVQKLQAKGANGPPLTLSEDVLKRINLSAGGTPGNAGMLKNEGKLSWPLALSTVSPQGEVKELREDINSLLPKAINEATNGKVNTDELERLQHAVDRLQQILTNNVRDVPPGQYGEARHFLNNLDDGLKVLKQPDAGLYFTPRYNAKGKTISDLVKHMTDQGLTFAPAVSGDEAAYVALHRLLAAYNVSARSQSQSSPK